MRIPRKKISNLQKSKSIEKQPVRNFGGHSTELWCEGGEATFISNMITESQSYQSQCVWFSSLVSKKETLAVLSEKLKKVAALDVKIIPMAQGQKVSRFIAWTFLTSEQRQHFFEQLKQESLLKNNLNFLCLMLDVASFKIQLIT